MKNIFLLFLICGFSLLSVSGAGAGQIKAEKVADKTARKAQDWFLKTVVYQLPLRSFTHEGTLNAAAQRLEFLAETGVGCVYLLPIVEADTDQNREFWSPRQKRSNTNNPCNPYRIKNYFKVDSEYGTNDDLKKFVEKAHSLGLKVMLDLVYYHCGPKADIIESNPDFVVRDENGKVVKGDWLYPEINFKNPKLREYLISNMEYFARDIKVDAFRTDVEGYIPIDFWETARERLEKINPEIAMVAESSRPECQLKAYDANYGYIIHRISKLFSAKNKGKFSKVSEIQNNWKWSKADKPRGARFMNFCSNHDTANDNGRLDNTFPHRAVDAMVATIFALDGIPMIFSGEEFADDSEYSIFANKWHSPTFTDWSSSYTADGKRRLEIVRYFSKLRRDCAIMNSGNLKWLDANNEKILAFLRQKDGDSILFCSNASDKSVETSINIEGLKKHKILYSQGIDFSSAENKASIKLAPYGFALVEL